MHLPAYTQLPGVTKNTGLPIELIIIPPELDLVCDQNMVSLTQVFDLEKLLAITTVHVVSFYTWVNLYRDLFLPIPTKDFRPTPLQHSLEVLRENNEDAYQRLIASFARYEVKLTKATLNDRLEAFFSPTVKTVFAEKDTHTTPSYEQRLCSKGPLLKTWPFRPSSMSASFEQHPKALTEKPQQAHCFWSFRWTDKDTLGFFVHKTAQMTRYGMVDDLLYHLFERFDFHHIARTRLFKHVVCG